MRGNADRGGEPGIFTGRALQTVQNEGKENKLDRQRQNKPENEKEPEDQNRLLELVCSQAEHSGEDKKEKPD